jgi:hypothetical protein
MARRQIAFSTYDDVIAEIDRLEREGYEQCGSWSLGQVCRHLSYYMRGSLEGFDFRLPWIVRKLLGPPLLRKILRGDEMKAGGRTIPASVPGPDVDEREAAAEARELLARLRDFSGELHPSPLFDRLTPDQWRLLHLKHAAHHLGFRVPKQGEGY